MENFKVIGTASEMSNLVGMYAYFMKNDKIAAKIQIIGKADNKYFICQIISPFNGVGNVAKLMTLDELKEWLIIPNENVESFVYNDYCETKEFRFKFPEISKD